MLAEQLGPLVREEAKENLVILIKCAAELNIDKMAIPEMRLTTFRLLRWEIDKALPDPEKKSVALGYLAIFMQKLYDEGLISITPLSLKMIMFT